MRDPLVILILLVVVAQQAAALPEVGSSFSSPVHASGNLESRASWAILEFRDSPALLSVEARSHAVIHYLNRTSTFYELDPIVRADGPPVESGSSRELDVEPFQASWPTLGFVGIRAESIVVRMQDESADLRPIGPKELDDGDDGTGLDNAVDTWVADSDPHAVAGTSNPLHAVHLSIEGLQAVELVGAKVSCPSTDCPTGGLRERTSAGAVSVSSLSFERITGLHGNATLDATPARIRFGGPSIGVSLQGALRMPKAKVSGECDCRLDGDQTLTLSGDVQLNALAPAPDGDRMTARISGEAIAFADEAPITLPGLAKATAATAAGVAFLVLLAKAVLGLFTRLGKKEALEHPKRQLIFAYIQENPGANFREVARNTSIASGTVRHHLTVLERAGHIVEHAHLGTVRLFENHGKFDSNWADMVLLREPALAQVHGWIKAHPASPQKDVLEAFEAEGWSRSTTQHRLARLVRGNLVAIRLQGRLKIYSAVERLAPKPAVVIARTAASAPPSSAPR